MPVEPASVWETFKECLPPVVGALLTSILGGFWWLIRDRRQFWDMLMDVRQGLNALHEDLETQIELGTDQDSRLRQVELDVAVLQTRVEEIQNRLDRNGNYRNGSIGGPRRESEKD